MLVIFFMPMMLLWLLKRGRSSERRDDAEAALVQMHLSWQERRKRWLDFVERKLSEIEARGASVEQVHVEHDDSDLFDVDPLENFHNAGTSLDISLRNQ